MHPPVLKVPLVHYFGDIGSRFDEQQPIAK
jgi:hypothetical protein